MLLGELLQRLSEGRQDALELCEGLDLVLLARAEAAAERDGMSLAELIAVAVEDFIGRADDEAWAQLVARIEESDAPGRACVEVMLKRRLAAGANRIPPAV